MKRFAAPLAISCLTFFSASAQNAPAALPTVDSHGDWLTRCFAIQSETPCDAMIALIDGTTKQRVLSLSLAYKPSRDQYVMQLAVPLMVSIPDGAVIEAPGYRSGALFIRRCDRGGCYIEMAVSPELIAGLKAAGSAGGDVIVTTPQGKAVTIKFSLKGFGDAVDAMVSKAREKATNSTTGSAP